MGLKPTHELHRRRFSRNVGLGLTLVAFVAVVFGLTMAKISSGDFVAPYAPPSVTGTGGGQDR